MVLSIDDTVQSIISAALSFDGMVLLIDAKILSIEKMPPSFANATLAIDSSTLWLAIFFLYACIIFLFNDSNISPHPPLHQAKV